MVLKICLIIETTEQVLKHRCMVNFFDFSKTVPTIFCRNSAEYTNA